MNFTERDYSAMRYRIDKVDLLTYNPLHSFPEFKKYPEFNVNLGVGMQKYFRNVFAYIAFTYDWGSPYVINYDNLLRRKKECLVAANFKCDADGKFPKIAEDILANKNPLVNRMIICFCRSLRNADWLALVGYEETLSKHLMWMTSGKMDTADGTSENLDPKLYSSVISNIESLRTNITELRTKFLTNDDNKDLIKAIYESIETDDLNITPEEIAYQLYMGSNPKLFNPYKQNIPVEEFIEKQLKMAMPIEPLLIEKPKPVKIHKSLPFTKKQ